MRLLHTTRLVFQEFFDADIPSYIILSHRWLHDEVSYQNFILGRKKSSQGYAKILGSCRQASRTGNGKDPLSTEEPERSHGWLFADHRHSTEWVWIDTCCIDKSSSAELSEAINSMYRWYSNAKCCHVYLHDVVKSEIPDNTMAQFKNSEWFTRGWTLQELLAPKDVIFFDKNWMELGDKITLSRKISRATLISDWHLLSFSPSTVRVAEKMQWMANRKTSRVEDEAYCLLGLFDINMPLLYGEGHNASRRLQQEILPTSDDESIFAWEHPTMMITSVLSSHLDQFGFKCDERHDGEYSAVAGVSRPPYTITNKGLKIKVPTELAKRTRFLLPLSCLHFDSQGLEWLYAIALAHSPRDNCWHRVMRTDSINTSPDHIFPGLYKVRTSSLWKRENLKEKGSESIYVFL